MSFKLKFKVHVRSVLGIKKQFLIPKNDLEAILAFKLKVDCF